jgi:Mg2+ and Co2+ transporter CorA
MNKSELTKAIKDMTRAQEIIERVIAEASGEDREQLQTIDDHLEDMITELEYIML